MPSQDTADYAFALHGGAGVNPARSYVRTPAHMEALARECGERLAAGAAALDVVEHAARELEASGLYVAGRGAAPNRAGFVEFDASIMDGHARRAGCVAAVRDVVHPISAARAVMDRTDHVLLVGAGAGAFVRTQGLPLIEDPQQYFRVPEGVEAAEMQGAGRHGTIGAVALDRQGRLAAATSTGGTFGKAEGRVGDTPLIGAGTWADDRIAISCTGTGEQFILAGGAQRVAAQVRYGGASLMAAGQAFLDDVAALGGDGGLIMVDRAGNIAMPFNSGGMKRASISDRQVLAVAVR